MPSSSAAITLAARDALSHGPRLQSFRQVTAPRVGVLREAMTIALLRAEPRHPAPLPLAPVLAALLTAGLAACSGGGAIDADLGVSASPRVAAGRSIPKGGGIYKVGRPYRVAGRWYHPRENPSYDRVGTASWYGAAFHGRRTSNGEVYDMHALTAGHPTLPMPSYAYVTNLHNGRTVLVRINDRGPYARDRLIDLSYRTAHTLGFHNRGLARVRIRYAGRAPLNGDDSAERRYLAAQSWYGGRVAEGRTASISTASIGTAGAGGATPVAITAAHLVGDAVPPRCADR
ncbi:MAG: septal ring lytic transglycosylase RlpA family protein [Hyphomicrobium sp.]|nr:septal ring lytic transglycosylase RlpA family protein [Hyphomicrobium sp.]